MRFSAFAVLTACVGTLLLTGCAPTKYKLDMTQYEHYNNEYSYARNLARLQGYDRALTDTEVPKDMVSDWGAVGLGADLLVDNWLYNINPSMPGSFGIGAGIKILQEMTSGPKIGEYDTMIAFVPVSVAKTELEAHDYFVNQMIKTFEPFAEEMQLEIHAPTTEPYYADIKNKKSTREEAWQLSGGTFLLNESIGCTKERSSSCLIGVNVHNTTEPQEPKPIPAWIDPEQPLAWFIREIVVVTKLNGIKPSQRDEIRYKWLTTWAKQLPKNAFMYVAPARKDGKRTPPFFTDGKKVWFFVIPKEE